MQSRRVQNVLARTNTASINDAYFAETDRKSLNFSSRNIKLTVCLNCCWSSTLCCVYVVILLDLLLKRSEITGVYSANLLDQLRTAIRKKKRGSNFSVGVLLQQDNPRVHTCKVTMDAVEQNGYKLIPHPIYSPDLASADFFLFPNLKKEIRGCHFRSDEEVVTAVEERVNGKDP